MNSKWMFEEWPDHTFARDVQILHTAVARLLAIFRKVLEPILGALAQLVRAPNS